MATFTDWIKQMNQIGNTTDPTQVYTRKSPMELMILQQAMGQKADAGNLAGFAVGKFLRGLFDDWKERYDARGTLNRMAEMNPNKRNEMLAFLEKNNPTQYQRMQEYLAKHDGTWDTWNKTPQPTSSTTAPTTPTTTPTKNLLGDTSSWTKYLPDTNTDYKWDWNKPLYEAGWQRNDLRF